MRTLIDKVKRYLKDKNTKKPQCILGAASHRSAGPRLGNVGQNRQKALARLQRNAAPNQIKTYKAVVTSRPPAESGELRLFGSWYRKQNFAHNKKLPVRNWRFFSYKIIAQNQNRWLLRSIDHRPPPPIRRNWARSAARRWCKNTAMPCPIPG